MRYNKECTFVESPAKRRRPNENNSEENGHSRNGGMNDFKHGRNGSIGSNGPYSNGAVGGGGYDMQQELLGWENGVPQFHMPTMDMDSGFGAAPEFALDPAFCDPAMGGYMGFDPMSASTTTAHPLDHKLSQPKLASSIEPEPSPQSASSGMIGPNLALPFDLTTGEPSLDQQSSSNCTIVGMSGELDPYLLSRYRYDQYNDAAFQRIRLRKMSDGLGGDASIPTFFTIQHNALASKAQPQEKPETLDRCRREVEEMVSNDVGKRLIRLFYKYVQPYFPILSREGGSHARDEDGFPEPSGIPTCLLAAIYGHALPFCAWDEKLCVDVYTPPSPDALFRIAWITCQSGLHTPSYAGLQTMLLFVQRRPTNKNVSDTPFKGVMISTAVSIAVSLGLNRDPTNWPIPDWEIKQRRRLAWATFIQDKWLALNSGRTGYIQADDWDVDMLIEEDFSDQDRKPDPLDPLLPSPCQHFVKLAELTTLIATILTDLFSIRATKALHTNLDLTLETAKPLRLRLTTWHQSLPPGLLSNQQVSGGPISPPPLTPRRKSLQHELNGNGSLHLAYITAKISLFRAMLRPRLTINPTTPHAEPPAALTALRTGALAVAREIFDFLDHLSAYELEAFWASYSRANFTMATSFIVLLFVTAPDARDAEECLELLEAWRSLLRIKSRSCDLLNLALLRLDAVFVAGMERLVELSPAALRAWGERGEGKG